MHSSWTTHNDWTCGMQFRFFADFQFRIGVPQLPLVYRVRSLLTAAAASMWNRSQMNECANETWIERIIAILCLFPFERSVVLNPSTFFDLEWFSLFYVADRLLNNKTPSNIPASIDTRDHFSIRISIKSFPHHTISVRQLKVQICCSFHAISLDWNTLRRHHRADTTSKMWRD